MNLQLPKGTRDLRPEEAIVRNKIVDTLKEVFELYGYSPFETPAFERYDVLASKYAGGAEILKETFKFKDQGRRELGLRYDLTVPLARFIGMNPNIKLPFKRYQIGDVFRDGPVERARYRQFSQCDVDIIGSKEMTADAELIALAQRAFKKLGLEIAIKVNNRKLLNDFLKSCGVKENKLNETILSLDKLEKFGLDAVKKELKQKKLDDKAISQIIKLVNFKGTNSEKLNEFKSHVSLALVNKTPEGISEIENLLSKLNDLKVEAEFDVSLARGLSYYTGTVVEFYLKNSSVKSSICAGGRYDKMIGAFLGKDEFPAVGISFGVDRIYDAYLEKNKIKKKTVSQIYIAPINTLSQSLKIAEQLRGENIKVDIDLNGRGPSKNLKYANSLSIPYVLFVGEEELRQNKVKLKDMKSGKESLMGVEELAGLFNKMRIISKD